LSLALKVDIKDEKVLRAFKKFPSAMIEAVSEGLFRGALEIQLEAKKRVPRATEDSFKRLAIEKQSKTRFLIGSPLKYAKVLELGSGPGGGSPKDPTPILKWIREKNISPNDSEMSEDDLAYVMARSIARKGTPKQPYLEPALKAKESRVIALVREGAAKGLRQVGL